MALDSYAGLKASIADWLMRGDLAAAIPDFIALAEAQINGRLRVRRMIARAVAAVSSEFCQAPADFAGPLGARLSTGEPLECLTVDAMLEARRAWAGDGAPRAYAVVGDRLQFWPAPAEGVEVELTYYARIPPLSDAAPTNWLLALKPDLYLYGALVQAAPYLADDARAETWGALFIAGLNDLQAASERERYGASLAPRTTQVA